MNRLYIDGKIISIPTFKMESGEIPHLTLCLCVRHKTRAGETRSETYRVSAWHKTALWAKDKLQRGQLVSVSGYLTLYSVCREEETLNRVEIAAEQFRLLQPLSEEKTEAAQNEQASVETDRENSPANEAA